MTDDNTDTTKTSAKTLWSETILEILYETLRKNKSDKELISVLKEVQQKGFKRDYILKKVARKVDESASTRVRQLLNKQ